MSAPSKDIVDELKRLAAENGGVLQPVAVVESARPSTSPLHSRFEWDNTKAAHEYRLAQARMLIRVSVHVIADDGQEDRIFVSLKLDREQDGGGYRTLVDVLSDKDMRKALLAEAIEECQYFERKYKRLTQLAGVIAAMRRIRKK